MGVGVGVGVAVGVGVTVGVGVGVPVGVGVGVGKTTAWIVGSLASEYTVVTPRFSRTATSSTSLGLADDACAAIVETREATASEFVVAASNANNTLTTMEPSSANVVVIVSLSSAKPVEAIMLFRTLFFSASNCDGLFAMASGSDTCSVNVVFAVYATRGVGEGVGVREGVGVGVGVGRMIVVITGSLLCAATWLIPKSCTNCSPKIEAGSAIICVVTVPTMSLTLTTVVPSTTASNRIFASTMMEPSRTSTMTTFSVGTFAAAAMLLWSPALNKSSCTGS